jgi:mRNA deadenylase 3'-5' endonuclease subunit Ccr4
MLVANGKEPPVTNKTSMFAGCLDYIWLQQGRWHVLETLALPYADDEGPQPEAVQLPACPNSQQPSDHLPIACKVLLREAK